MELVKIATGEPITREQIEAAQAALGLELALPYDLTGHGLYVGRTGNGAMDFPSMDPTKPGIFICVGHTNDGSTATLSTPSSMSLLMSNSPSTTNIGTSVFVETRAAAGATGTRTTTMASNFLGYALGIPMFLING